MAKKQPGRPFQRVLAEINTEYENRADKQKKVRVDVEGDGFRIVAKQTDDAGKVISTETIYEDVHDLAWASRKLRQLLEDEPVEMDDVFRVDSE